jgi:CHRD domain-containing protein
MRLARRRLFSNQEVSMKRVVAAAAVLVLVIGTGIVFTQGGFQNITEQLTGLKEVQVISTTGHGEFHARISKDESEISWELSYADLEGAVQQSHIHFGPPNNTGGIAVFFCTNLGNGPAGTQLCPAPPATISGVITAANVIGPLTQGIEAGALSELIDAIRDGKTYVNVHSAKWPLGEIRSQITHEGGVHD